MDRFDIPTKVQKVIEVAIEEEVIDYKDIYELAITHGDNWNVLIDTIIEYAYSNHHWAPTQHEAVVRASEDF